MFDFIALFSNFIAIGAEHTDLVFHRRDVVGGDGGEFFHQGLALVVCPRKHFLIVLGFFER